MFVFDMCTPMFIYIDGYVYICIHIYIGVCIYIYMYICICMFVCVVGLCTCAYIHTYMDV